MKQKDFFAQYQTKEWYELSKRIKARDNNTCQMCGRNDLPLNVHHLSYGEDGNILDVHDSQLITLCEECHNKQKECRERTYELIGDLRSVLTDFELSNILLHFYYDIVDDGPICFRLARPTEKFIEKCFYSDEKEYAKNLLVWRERVRKAGWALEETSGNMIR